MTTTQFFWILSVDDIPRFHPLQNSHSLINKNIWWWFSSSVIKLWDCEVHCGGGGDSTCSGCYWHHPFVLCAICAIYIPRVLNRFHFIEWSLAKIGWWWPARPKCCRFCITFIIISRCIKRKHAATNNKDSFVLHPMILNDFSMT